MSNEEAVYYLELLRINLQANSFFDIALVKAIEALKKQNSIERKCEHGKLIDAYVVLRRIKRAIEFYSHSTQGDFDTGRKVGLISAEEIVAEEATNAENLLAEWEECDYKKS